MFAAYLLAAIGELKKIHTEEIEDSTFSTLISKLIDANNFYSIADLFINDELKSRRHGKIALLRLEKELINLKEK